MGRARPSIRQRNEEAMERSVKVPAAGEQSMPAEAPSSAPDTTDQAPGAESNIVTDEPVGERPTGALEPAEAPAETAKKTRVLGPNTRPQTVPDGYAHLGLYLSKDTLQGAKDAYVTDLRRLPGAPSSFAGWIARAIDNHAARTPNMRAMLAEKHPEASGKKVNRAFILEDKTIAALKETVGIDHDAGRMQSASQLASEALRVAISEARVRNDGTLIPAPARLPNHPTPKS